MPRDAEYSWIIEIGIYLSYVCWIEICNWANCACSWKYVGICPKITFHRSRRRRRRVDRANSLSQIRQLLNWFFINNERTSHTKGMGCGHAVGLAADSPDGGASLCIYLDLSARICVWTWARMRKVAQAAGDRFEVEVWRKNLFVSGVCNFLFWVDICLDGIRR